MTIEVTYFNLERAKGSFLGNFGVRVSAWNNLVINNISLLKTKEGKKFIVLPEKKKFENGIWKKDFSFIEMEKDVKEAFQKSCIKAIDIHLTRESQLHEPSQSLHEQKIAMPAADDDELPF